VVAHLALTLDFAELEETVDNEVEVINRIGTAYAGTGKTFIAASGTPILLGRTATGEDHLDPSGPAGARARTADAALAWHSKVSARASSGCHAASTERATATGSSPCSSGWTASSAPRPR